MWEIHLRDQAETMSPHHWIVTLIVGTLALPGAEAPRLLTPGDYWADDLAADTAGQWLALMPGHGEADRLTDVTVRVQRHTRAAGDDPDLNRASVLVEGPRGAPRFLVRGLQGLQPGKTLRVALEYRLTVDCPLTVRHPMATMPWLLTLHILPAEGDLQDHQAVAVVQHGARSATLGPFPWWPDRTGLRDPTVEWVGDLDGDGSVDMLIDFTDGEKGEACPTLWMGSTDPLAPLLRPVATFFQHGC